MNLTQKSRHSTFPMSSYLLVILVFVQFKKTVCDEIDLRETFEKYRIIPDMLLISPQNPLLEIFFFDKVKFGTKLTPNAVFNVPTLLHYPIIAGHYYTILMTDPDAPHPKDPSERERLHWLVVNVPGCEYRKGKVLAEYRGIIRDKDKAPHRYVTLVYHQPGELEFEEKKISSSDVKSRRNFNTMKFARKYNFTDLIAGNFFLGI